MSNKKAIEKIKKETFLSRQEKKEIRQQVKKDIVANRHCSFTPSDLCSVPYYGEESSIMAPERRWIFEVKPDADLIYANKVVLYLDKRELQAEIEAAEKKALSEKIQKAVEKYLATA